MDSQEKEKSRLGIVPFDPLFVYIAIIYGVTRVVEAILGNPGNFWERVWIKNVEFWDVNEHDFVVWVSSLVLIILFWTVALAFLVVDLTGCLQKYKTQPGKNSPPDMLKVAEAIATIIFNQTVVSLTFGAGGYWISVGLLGDRDLKEVPTFLHLMRDLLVSYTIFDIGFYMLHRLMHTKYFYKRIHKLHHSWTSPIGVTAIFCHPTEHLITNLIPAIAGPVVLKSHYCTIWIWFSTIAITTVSDHSGYHLPFLKSPQFHDNHHVRFTECFGTSGMMDFIFKTDLMFRRSIFFKRHRVLMSLKTTINELYPKKVKEVIPLNSEASTELLASTKQDN